MYSDAVYPAKPLTFTVSEYFRYHLDNPGCISCGWSLSPSTLRFSLAAISSLCPVHGSRDRSRTHPRATDRMRVLAGISEGGREAL